MCSRGRQGSHPPTSTVPRSPPDASGLTAPGGDRVLLPLLLRLLHHRKVGHRGRRGVAWVSKEGAADDAAPLRGQDASRTFGDGAGPQSTAHGEPERTARSKQDRSARGHVERGGARVVGCPTAGETEDLHAHADCVIRRVRAGKEGLEASAPDYPRHRPEVEGWLPLERRGWGVNLRPSCDGGAGEREG